MSNYEYENENIQINVYHDNEKTVHITLQSKYDKTPIRFYLQSDEVVGLYNLLDIMLYEI